MQTCDPALRVVKNTYAKRESQTYWMSWMFIACISEITTCTRVICEFDLNCTQSSVSS